MYTSNDVCCIAANGWNLGIRSERRLDPRYFLRINRGILVNVAGVAELHADAGGHLTVRLKDPSRSELSVSRDRMRALKERLGLA